MIWRKKKEPEPTYPYLTNFGSKVTNLSFSNIEKTQLRCSGVEKLPYYLLSLDRDVESISKDINRLLVETKTFEEAVRHGLTSMQPHLRIRPSLAQRKTAKTGELHKFEVFSNIEHKQHIINDWLFKDYYAFRATAKNIDKLLTGLHEKAFHWKPSSYCSAQENERSKKVSKIAEGLYNPMRNIHQEIKSLLLELDKRFPSAEQANEVVGHYIGIQETADACKKWIVELETKFQEHEAKIQSILAEAERTNKETSQLIERAIQEMKEEKIPIEQTQTRLEALLKQNNKNTKKVLKGMKSSASVTAEDIIAAARASRDG